ncbi:unnamed protein product [Brachionus calyciflorus]|uniref:Uncharacterized protein n=1 Tax=Brachionus calyciflorus TaxID=104777 RepID=A0A813QQJ2_9BILA|nr:unnamed protein product [Brachionus calyciflorus]
MDTRLQTIEFNQSIMNRRLQTMELDRIPIYTRLTSIENIHKNLATTVEKGFSEIKNSQTLTDQRLTSIENIHKNLATTVEKGIQDLTEIKNNFSTNEQRFATLNLFVGYDANMTSLNQSFIQERFRVVNLRIDDMNRQVNLSIY